MCVIAVSAGLGRLLIDDDRFVNLRRGRKLDRV